MKVKQYFMQYKMERFKITGFNLFHQWLSNTSTIANFTPLHHETAANQFSVLHIDWAYNILNINAKFYLSGLYSTDTSKFFELNIPCEACKEIEHFIISGNDRYIIAVDSKSSEMWKCEFKRSPLFEWKLIDSFQNTEHPIRLTVSGRMNLCLTDKGTLYDIPVKIDTAHCTGKIIEVQCGYEHALLLTDYGYVYSWGNGRRCQLGHGDLMNYEEPKLVEALAGIKIKKICTGGWHCCALSESGDLYIWGWNESGQLGLRDDLEPSTSKKQSLDKDTPSSRPNPTIVEIYDTDTSSDPLELSVVDMSCGSRHTVIILEDNSIWSSGLNTYGQLGAGPDIEKVSCFRKVHKEDKNINVKCGPWSTLIWTD